LTGVAFLVVVVVDTVDLTEATDGDRFIVVDLLSGIGGGGGRLDEVIPGFVGDFDTDIRVLTFDAVEALDMRLDRADAGRSSTSEFAPAVLNDTFVSLAPDSRRSIAEGVRGLDALEGGRRVVEATCAAAALGLRIVEA
jgi:hypothetical protein